LFRVLDRSGIQKPTLRMKRHVGYEYSRNDAESDVEQQG
jgi:hypothetical protein